MSTLLKQWEDKAFNTSRTENEQKSFWKKYQHDEFSCYKTLLNIKTSPILGTVASFSDMFNVDIITFIGFLSGLNDSLKTPNNLNELERNTIITLDYDAELLYKNMKESGYDLSVWNNTEYSKNNINKTQVINKILSSDDKKTFYYYIYINDLISAKKIISKYCNCNEDEFQSIIKLYVEEYLKDPEIVKANAVAKELLNKPKCPTCSSTNVQKIGTGERVASVATLGIFSKKINKSFKCKSCGYTW